MKLMYVYNFSSHFLGAITHHNFKNKNNSQYNTLLSAMSCRPRIGTYTWAINI